MTNRTYKFIDLFAGCGGLEDGFLQAGRFTGVASVEWLKPQVDTLAKRLQSRWGVKNAAERVLHFDLQREDELFSGWQNDPTYGSSKGLDYFINQAKGIDIIIGGPPCQAYSVAGRVRDENGMHNDYRNYLFEHYLNAVKRYQPKLCVFENVPGLLSATPNGYSIASLIQQAFIDAGYEIVDELGKYSLLNASEYGVPQVRKRVIIIGLRKDIAKNTQEVIKRFYSEILPKYKSVKKMTVYEAIGDLPACLPLIDTPHKRASHNTPPSSTTWHQPRFHSERDQSIFELLAADLASGECKYTCSKVISNLYAERVGSHSPIHRYHVLRPNEPSTTIIAHLYKDGNRYIHYDPKQRRTITPREAARLQSFADDFDFVGSRGDVYQMIGNAVPPVFAKNIALAVRDLLDELLEEK